MTIPRDVIRCLENYRAQYAPGRVVHIAPTGTLPAAWSSPEFAQRDITRDFAVDRELTGSGRFDLALVLDAPKTLTTVATRQLLARLRDYSARTVIAAFDSDTARETGRWSVAEFLSLGFRRVAEARQFNSRYWVYRYDIRDYKITPDWLNSRYWANPGRWGRERW